MDTWIIAFVGGIAAVAFFVVPKWIGRAWGRRVAQRALRDIELGRQSQTPIKRLADWPFSVRCDTSGLAVVDHCAAGGTSTRVTWHEICRVVVFKHDNFGHDSISIGVIFQDGTAWDLPEEAEGWSELAESLDKHLPGCKPFHEWFMAVAFPAFETNLTEIFARDGAPAAVAGA